MTLRSDARTDVKRASRLAEDAVSELSWVQFITTDSLYTVVRMERAREALEKAAEALTVALRKQKEGA